MKYRRALLFAVLGRDAGPSLSSLRRVAPQLEHLQLLVTQPASAWPWAARAAESTEAQDAALQALLTSANGVAQSIDLQLSPELSSAAIAALCVDLAIDLIVLDADSLRATTALLLQRRRLPAAILWTRDGLDTGPLRHLGCVSLDLRSLLAVAAFLRDHADPSLSVAVLLGRPMAREDLEVGLELSGIEANVEVSSPGEAPGLRPWFERWARERKLDLLVFARAPSALFLGSVWTGPVLLLPQPRAASTFGRRALDIADVLDDRGALRARVDQATALGGLEPAADQTLAIVSAGQVQRSVPTRAGETRLPADLEVASVGLYRKDEASAEDPLLAIEQHVALIRPTSRPLVLYDAQLGTAALHRLKAQYASARLELLAVRMRPTRTCNVIRERLRAAGLAPAVADARAVLDEGEALDVSEPLDALRLARVAARLVHAGFLVAGIVYRGPVRPCAHGFTAQGEHELTSPPAAAAAAVPASHVSGGNMLELELDNAQARRWLLEAIEQSRHSLHLQVYMALDDDVGSAVEVALAGAAARGVAVRVLVDSMHGLHGSFGVHNPLLERLAARPGVELRTWRPITELPSLADIKQRDHRKLLVADGRLALVGGRNLSHEYYAGFDEVPLTATSDWRVLPWLDAGLRARGPVVADLQRAFLDAWTEVGGAGFEITTPPPEGNSAARIVLHRGLCDANTLESYLELIASATSHVYVVNGFPLALELQHALLAARERGVRVRALFGHVTPMHGGQPFDGSWSTARTAATELVHSRLDPLVEAGAEVYLFAQRDVAGWSPALGVVHPHVHAKTLSIDGARCSVGSANLDITASYWESELLVVVEDAAITRAFEAQVDALMAASTPVRRDDVGWQELAKRRSWMRHWPGVLAV